MYELSIAFTAGLVCLTLGWLWGYWTGYANAMEYATKKLNERLR